VLARHSGSVTSESAEPTLKSSETLSGHTPRFRPESVWLAALLTSTAAVLLGLAIYLALHQVLLKGVAPDEVVKTTLTLMAGLAAVLTGVYAYRKQRLSEADGARADSDQGRADGEQLTHRYSTAAEQLGHEKAAVRLAGVFAMARLADDWSKQRQQCIDVLCAYLRMPAADEGDLSEREVRATIIRTITAHLRKDSAISWSQHDFDFTGAALHDAMLRGARFSGKYTTFYKARFSGEYTNFVEARFSGKFTSFYKARFSGYTNFAEANFSGEYTIFNDATFSGAQTIFNRATFAGAQTTFDGATFSGADTSFEGSTFSGGTTADAATVKSSFVGTTVVWGPITSLTLSSTATGTA
jgi:Pentapeptide repeats (9 copies)